MFRLLIIDNEKYIVNSLVQLFRDTRLGELEPVGVYSAREAIEWLERTKIDIVLTDIRMPKMNGLELQKQINRSWPRCKVIFLSGYDDFSYVQEALRGGSSEYILKTEGNDAVVAAVERAMRELTEELRMEKLLQSSKERMQQAMTLLQTEFVTGLLLGGAPSPGELERQIADLGLPLQSGAPVLMAVGRIDRWKEPYSLYDRALMHYAVQNVAAEYFDTAIRHISVVVDRSRIVWLVQPGEAAFHTLDKRMADAWKMAGRFMQGTFEYIQSTCRELLQLQVSVAIARGPVEWELAGKQFEALKALLSRGLWHDSEMLLTESERADVEPDGEAPHAGSRQIVAGLFDAIEQGERQRCLSLLNAYLASVSPSGFARTQAYHLLLAVCMELKAEAVVYERLTGLDPAQDWPEAADGFVQAVNDYFARRQSDSSRKEDHLLGQIQRFVEAHLDKDVSLTSVAEHVGLNPSYLSRLFKQKMNIGLSDYIFECRLERAKKLLREQQLKIWDVAQASGFLSEAHFYRMFKKATGRTPQEYRDASRK